MESHTFFLQLLIILLTARLFSEIAIKLGAPSVIGELVAGAILGPSLLGWLQPNEIIRLLAEVGIILLLFKVGLQTDARRLIHAGYESILVAAGGLVAPFTFGFSIGYWMFGLEPLVALFIGGTLTATSIGITVRVLSDLGCQHSREGHIVLGAAVLDDVIGIVLLAMLYEFSSNDGINLVNAGKVFTFIAIFFVLAPLAAKLISLLIRHFENISLNPGLIPTAMISLVLFFAWLAHEVGAPEILGGFAAGLALSRRFFLPFGTALHSDDPGFSIRIEQQMTPIIHLFTPIFFVMVGLSLNFHMIEWSSPFIWAFSMVLFVVAVLGKFAGALLIRERWQSRFAIGIAMVPRGEVGLIFAELGRTSGIFNHEVYAGVIIVIALTTLIPPFIMKWYFARHIDPISEPD